MNRRFKFGWFLHGMNPGCGPLVFKHQSLSLTAGASSGRWNKAVMIHSMRLDATQIAIRIILRGKRRCVRRSQPEGGIPILAHAVALQ